MDEGSFFKESTFFYFGEAEAQGMKKKGLVKSFPLGMNFESVKKKEATAFAWRLFFI